MRINKLVVGPVTTNCYIVSNEDTKEAVIIDPGAQPDKIMQKVQDEGVTVKVILLTHGHFDHICAVNEMKNLCHVKIYIGEEDADLMENTDENVSAMFGCPYIARADETLRDGEQLQIAGFSIEVLHTPGHTKGGVCYYFREEGVMFCGDTIFCQSVGRTDFPTGNSLTLSESIKQKIFCLPDDVQLFPGHGESTTVGYEKKYNLFF